MAFPTVTCEYVTDPITPEDLIERSPLDATFCPYCAHALNVHETNEGAESDHVHRAIGESEVCRRLYECKQILRDGQVQLFYFYRDLENPNKWASVKVTESAIETADDTATIRFGRKKLKAEVKPKWRFLTSQATKVDFTEYFNLNLVVGLELEVDFRDSRVSGTTLTRLFGVTDSDYHHVNGCPVCGNSECWNHLPDNLIRAIERDASIEGWEFILYGGRLGPEEFARRLPLTKIAAHFIPTWRNSLHTHAMIVHNITRIPQVIVKNVWQLFRFYYPGWVYIFGNFPREQGFLRNQSGAGHDYVPFKLFNRTPFSDRWTYTVSHAKHVENGGGLYLGKSEMAEAMSEPELDYFDVEIRTSDSTTDLEQIVGIRALTRALVIRAAQLSNFGLISIETNKDTWAQSKATTLKLNTRTGLTDLDEAFMKSMALDFAKELSPFMSEYERQCVRNLIEKPVRTRTEQEQAKVFTPKSCPLAKDMRRLIALGEIEAENEEAWVSKVAALIEAEPGQVTEAIHDLKGYFDREMRKVVLA